MLIFFAIIRLVMMSLLFVILIPTPSSIFFRCILDVSGCRLRTLEAGLGTLLSMSVVVVDSRTIPWSGRTTPEVFPSVTPPEVFQLPPLSESIFKRRWLSNRDKINFAWDDASSENSWAIVSVRVATVDISAAMAVARLARALTVSAW